MTNSPACPTAGSFRIDWRIPSSARGAPVRRQLFLLIDLDRFKQVNDTVGHHIGDELLKHVGRLFVGRVRRTDTVARTGGDEFSVVLEEPMNRADAMRVARKLTQTSRAPHPTRRKYGAYRRQRGHCDLSRRCRRCRILVHRCRSAHVRQQARRRGTAKIALAPDAHFCLTPFSRRTRIPTCSSQNSDKASPVKHEKGPNDCSGLFSIYN